MTKTNDEPTYRGLPRIEAGLVDGKPLVGDGRPDVWHKLADRLIASGWYYNTENGEWAHGRAHPIVGAELGWEFTERGRIAWENDGSKAWLHHPGPAPTTDDLLARRTVAAQDSHVTRRDVEYHTATEGYCPACGADRSEVEECRPDGWWSLFSIELVVAALDLEAASQLADSAVDFLKAGEADGWVCRNESVHTYEPERH